MVKEYIQPPITIQSLQGILGKTNALGLTFKVIIQLSMSTYESRKRNIDEPCFDEY